MIKKSVTMSDIAKAMNVSTVTVSKALGGREGVSEALRGKKVVLITAPQSYVEGGIAPDLFMANFSGQQALHMLADDTIPAEIKQYLSARVQELMGEYKAEYGAEPEKCTAAGLLTKAVAAGNGLTQALLRPYAAVSRWLLDTRDAAAAASIMQGYDDVTALEQPVDWEAELETALSRAVAAEKAAKQILEVE